MSGRRNWGARMGRWTRDGRGVVVLENELLRIAIDLGRGAEVIEFLYKPRDADLAPIGPAPGGPLPHPADPLLAFIDTYAGGWQEIFPNGGAPSELGGVRFGQHDEAWQLPWSCDVLADTEDEVAVRLSVELRRVPFRLTREVRLRAGRARYQVRHAVHNLSRQTLPAMWGQHLAYGPPFLRPGSRIELPAGVRVIPHAEPLNPGRRRLSPEPGTWPTLAGAGGGMVDLSVVPEPGTASEIAYLTGFEAGWYRLIPPGGPAVRVEWDARVLPYLWFWQEFGDSAGYPWYGRLYTIGLEPFSSYPTNGLAEAVDNGTALRLGPGSRELELAVEVMDG